MNQSKDEGRKRVPSEGDREIGEKQLFIASWSFEMKECVFRHLQCGFRRSLSIVSLLFLYLCKWLNQKSIF